MYINENGTLLLHQANSNKDIFYSYKKLSPGLKKKRLEQFTHCIYNLFYTKGQVEAYDFHHKCPFRNDHKWSDECRRFREKCGKIKINILYT